MTSSQSSLSPLARLVLFMVCLSIAGSISAGAHYSVVDLPAQKEVQAPLNGHYPLDACGLCRFECAHYGTGCSECTSICST